MRNGFVETLIRERHLIFTNLYKVRLPLLRNLHIHFTITSWSHRLSLSSILKDPYNSCWPSKRCTFFYLIRCTYRRLWWFNFLVRICFRLTIFVLLSSKKLEDFRRAPTDSLLLQTAMPLTQRAPFTSIKELVATTLSIWDTLIWHTVMMMSKRMRSPLPQITWHRVLLLNLILAEHFLRDRIEVL